MSTINATDKIANARDEILRHISGYTGVEELKTMNAKLSELGKMACINRETTNALRDTFVYHATTE